MESLVSVEKECEKTIDLFDSFYNDVDQNLSKVIEYAQSAMNELSQSKYRKVDKKIFIFSLNLSNCFRFFFKVENDQKLKSQAAAVVQSCKEQIKEFIKNYSDKHKDLHANVSKIGKVIDKV
jgi:F0F1-type ATP synthase alpha subunit